MTGRKALPQAVAEPKNAVQIPPGEQQDGQAKQQIQQAQQGIFHQGGERKFPKRARYNDGQHHQLCQKVGNGGAHRHLQADGLDGRVGMKFRGVGVPAAIEEKLLPGADKFPARRGIQVGFFLPGGGGRTEQNTSFQPGSGDPVAHDAGNVPAKAGGVQAPLFQKQSPGGLVGQPALAGLHVIARARDLTGDGILPLHRVALLSAAWRGRSSGRGRHPPGSAAIGRTFAAATGFAVREGATLLVLDEVCAAISCGFLPEGEVLAFLDGKPDDLEVVMTGRNPSEALQERADYITEMVKRRHPFDKGIGARKGIEL